MDFSDGTVSRMGVPCAVQVTLDAGACELSPVLGGHALPVLGNEVSRVRVLGVPCAVQLRHLLFSRGLPFLMPVNFS